MRSRLLYVYASLDTSPSSAVTPAPPTEAAPVSWYGSTSAPR